MNGRVTAPHRPARRVEKARKSAATSRFPAPTSRSCNSRKIFVGRPGTGSTFVGQADLVGAPGAHLAVAAALSALVNDERDDREHRGRGDTERQSDDVVQLPLSCLAS